MKENKSNKQKEFSEKIYKVLFVVLAIAIVVVLAISFIKSKSSTEADTTEDVSISEATEPTAANVAVSNAEEEVAEETVEIEIPEKDLDWDEIKAENEDIYAWIYVPGTDVDYPVLSSKEGVDKDFYLDHNLDGSYGPYPGCIYSQNEYNATDFSDNNLILYGHNMKDGSMFSSLHNYEDLTFFEANRYIYIYTPETTHVYEVFAAYKTDNYLIPETFDTTTEYTYSQYLAYIYGGYNDGMTTHISEDVVPTTSDKLITLSTCVSGEKTHRWLVQGVMIQ